MSVALRLNLLLCVLIYLCTVDAQPCPNSCNGHGICEKGTRECECQTGFEGPDCSKFTCPKGAAWTDFAIQIDNAHNLATCSNRGICDSTTGACSCMAGYEGGACERLSCPSNCNGRGKCMSMKHYARTKDPGTGRVNALGAFIVEPVYNYEKIWDADKIYGCYCDMGYGGPDCSIQLCPNGDDPLTGNGIPTRSNPSQFNDIQIVSCKAQKVDNSDPTFTLTYLGSTTVPLPYSSQAKDIVSALEALPTVNGVVVSMYGSQACLPTGTSFTVEFTQDFGNLPLMIADGSKLNPFPVGSISVSKQQAGTKENLQCSNRGLCDNSVGFCGCSTNFDTSNGYNQPGTRGDCGYTLATIQGCPGSIQCSAHGVCSGFPTFVCDCANGWTGADCSTKTCASGTSWFVYPSGENQAHLYENNECSDMGVCDRASGSCTCMNGFTGAACDRMICPGSPVDCNGHGSCADMYTLATMAKVNGVSARYTYGLIPNNAATWDYNRIFGCACDDAWTGYDCSQRVCPLGDDPYTTGQVDAVQQLSCLDSTGMGSVVLTFREESTPIFSGSVTAADLTAILEALPTVGKVHIAPLSSTTVAAADMLCTPEGNNFLVTFLTQHGELPLIQFKTQNIEKFIISTTVVGTKEMSPCSNRGLCDPSTGLCTCFTGFGASDGMGNRGNIKDCGWLMPLSFQVI